jgi:hypothetical protein
MDTIFNPLQYNYSTTADWPILSITEAKLNEALANLTLNTMFALQQWNTVVLVEIEETANVYSFAARKNLIIPYFLSLGVAIPFLILGGISMYQNGVSAIDGGFVQVLMTTTGSKTLEPAAAAGSLGGNENTSKDLPNLQICFGELIDHTGGSGEVRRAGFGTKDETAPLNRSATYGFRGGEK